MDIKHKFFFMFFVQFVAFVYLNFKNDFDILFFLNQNNENSNDLNERSCNWLKIKYNDSVAMSHFQRQASTFNPIFKDCENMPKLGNILTIEHLNATEFSSNKNTAEIDHLLKQANNRRINLNDPDADLYHFKLNHKNLLKELRLEEEEERLLCFVQVIDKRLKEREWRAVTASPKFFFERKFKHEIITNRFGFYQFICKIETEEEPVVVYEDILNLLPKHMRKFKEKTEIFFKKVDKIKTTLLDSTTNPMLNDLKLDQCEKRQDLVDQVEEGSKKMNVLIIGIDSVSYNNLKRAFPLTYKYLREGMENFVFYENFNKVGENTYPNLLALFAGVRISTYEELNLTSDVDFYYKIDSTNHDLVPFVWRDYEKLGYVTLYNEEAPEIGCFNYIKKGFRYWPTSFYAHPFWFHYTSLRKREKRLLCYNNKPTYTYSLKMINQLINRLNENEGNKQLPYFSFNFMKYYTHDLLVVPQGFDSGLRDMLENFFKNGYLNNTMLIFFSDHGSRMNDFAHTTDAGKMERSMPFLGIRLPNSMQHTNYAKNLNNNRNKLISTFDLYKTLKHFFYMNKHGLNSVELNSDECREYFKKSNHSIRSLRGVSLFEKIKSGRNCMEAIVPSGYCLCNPKASISEKSFYEETKYDVISAARVIINEINKITDSVRSECGMFAYDKIASLKRSVFSTKSLYEFQILLQPGDALFEATLKYEKKKSKLVLHDKILRISRYDKQSDCMSEHQFYGFCFCKNKKEIKVNES